MSAADAKAALKACEQGIALIIAQQKSNAALVADYNARSADVTAKRDAYNNAKRDRENVQRDWDNRKNDIANAKRGESRDTWKHEAFNSNGDWCNNEISGWEDDGDRDVGWVDGGCCRHRRRCKKGGGLVDREANEQTTNEKGGRPGNYNEPWPNDAAPVTQNQTPINIACCANTTNIVGSQITDSTISQQNNCLQNKKDAVTAAEKAEADAKAAATKAAAAEKAAAEKAAADKVAADKVAAEKAAADKAAAASSGSKGGTSTGSNDTPDDSKKKMMIIAAIVAAIICFCISSVLVLLMVMM